MPKGDRDAPTVYAPGVGSPDDPDSMAELLRKVARVAPVPLGPVLDVIPDGDFAVERELARGGMGRVLVARQRRLARVVAIKELLTRHPETEARFVREAMITAGLEHPSIVPVHDVGRTPAGEPFYAMKLVEGEALSARLGRGKPLGERMSLLSTVLAATKAMAYAHSRGVVHRDLKPDNILCGEFGETLVIDWGLAKVVGSDDAEHDTSLPPTAFGDRPAPSNQPRPPANGTRVGTVLGTPDFMPPEQARGEPVDASADVYAIGAILYTVLADHMPYEGAADTVAEVRRGPPLSLSRRWPSMPSELGAIVQKAMARRPADRYPTARELGDDLESFLTGRLVGAHRYSSWQLARRWLRRNRLVLSVTALAVTAMLAVGIVSVQRVVAAGHKAESELASAVAARAREAQRYDDLLLAQAQSHLERDPTLALAWLERLDPHGRHFAEALALTAAAQKRGAAARILGTNIRDVAYASDDTVIIGDGDGHIRSMNVVTGATAEIGHLDGPVAKLLVLADGVVAGGAGLAHATSHGPLLPLAGHRAPIVALAATATSLVAAGSDGEIRRFSLPGHLPSPVLSVHGHVYDLALDGDVVYARTDDGVVAFGTTLLKSALPGTGGLSLAGHRLAAGGRNLVRIWDLERHTTTDLAVAGDIVRVALAGDVVAAIAADGTVTEWSHGIATQLAHHGQTGIDLCSDGSVVFSRGSTLRAWHAGDVRKLHGHTEVVVRVRCSPSATSVASVADDGSARIWSLRPQQPPTVTDLPALQAWLRTFTEAHLDDHEQLR